MIRFIKLQSTKYDTDRSPIYVGRAMQGFTAIASKAIPCKHVMCVLLGKRYSKITLIIWFEIVFNE